MKCEEFRSNVDGLARGALLEARAHEDAAAHEETCAACAARLADERALTEGLRALAATMSGASAPARAEVALLSAFRSRAAATAACARAAEVSAATSNPSNVVSLVEHAGAKSWSWVRTVAVASMAAAAAVALFMLVPPFPPVPGGGREAAANSSKGATIQGRDDAAAKSAQSTAAQSNVGHESSPSVAGGSQGLKDEVECAPSRTLTQRRAPARALSVSYGNASRGVTQGGSSPTESAGAGEIMTEFIPLVQDAGFAQSEGGHLMRVELPRTALASFGIPVNAEQAGGRVKADVLLGEDGTARAIRFVR
jgi:hypothetical protein